MLAFFFCIHQFIAKDFSFPSLSDYFPQEFCVVHPFLIWFFVRSVHESDEVNLQMHYSISKIHQEAVSTDPAFTTISSDKLSLILEISFVVLLLFARIFSSPTFLFRICISQMPVFRLHDYWFFFIGLHSLSLMSFFLFEAILFCLIILISVFGFQLFFFRSPQLFSSIWRVFLRFYSFIASVIFHISY